MKVRAAVLRQASRTASEPPAGQEAGHCSPRDTSPGSGVTRTGCCQRQLGASPATPPQRTPARPPSRLPPASHCAHPREAAAPGARGHRGGASSALRAQDRHLGAGVGRAAQAARSHPDPARQARRHPALPPPHPGPHLPFSGTRSGLATPVPRTGAPPRRGRSEPLSSPDPDSGGPRACAASARRALPRTAPLLRVFATVEQRCKPTNRRGGAGPEPERGRGSRQEAGGDFRSWKLAVTWSVQSAAEPRAQPRVSYVLTPALHGKRRL